MEMPKFGATTNPSCSVTSEIKEIGSLGFDFVEIGIEEPGGSPKILYKKASRINRLVKKYGMFSIGHAAWWIDLGSPHDVVREAWLEECKRIIDAGRKIRIRKITFHSHSQGVLMSDRSVKKEIIKNYVDSMKTLVDYAGNSMSVMLENTTEMESVKDFGRIISGVKGLGVNLDVGHAFITGGMKDITAYIRKFSKKIEHVHMHDNHGKADEHLPVGIAKIDFRKAIEEFKKAKYDKTISLEVFVPERIITKISAEIVREMWS